MGHSSDVHRLVLDDHGIHLLPIDVPLEPKHAKRVRKRVTETQKMRGE
jgi:hypothetical protein